MKTTIRTIGFLTAGAALLFACGEDLDTSATTAGSGTSASGGSGGTGPGGSGGSGGEPCADEPPPFEYTITDGACTTLHEWGGDGEDQYVGRALVLGGDHDGDGSRDLLVGSSEGVHIRSADGAILATLRDTQNVASLASLDHDVSGDGVTDIGASVVVCPEQGSGGGPVTEDEPCVYSTRALDAVSGATLAEFADTEDIVSVGDRDGDGQADYALRTLMDVTQNIKSVIELRSSADEDLLGTITGGSSPEEWIFGAAFRDAGDLNGDDVSDLVVTVINLNLGQSTIRVYSGGNNALLSSYAVPPTLVGELWGGRVERAGDLDGDGLTDLLVQDHLYFPQGAVHAFRGSDLSILWSDAYLDGTQADELGSDRTYSLAFERIADLDGDGIDDAVVAGPKRGLPPILNGFGSVVTVVSGATGVSFVSMEETITDGMTGYHLGSSVAVLPDLDGDDRQEIVLAAPDSPFACVERAGRVLVLNCAGR